jgi:inositol-pentakisphosphate 2-kinase
MECTIEISGKDYALEYLAEGAANVVYKLRPNHKDLLRLRKTRSSIPYSEIVHSFETVVTTLFPNDALIHPTLFKLPDAGVLIPRLNKALLATEANGGRPGQRCGVYLATDEEYGIFVQDMTPRHEKERFIEFKPKWLIQSPSAPAQAKRCRTCALREMRRTGNVVGGRGDGGFCPLDLLSTEDGVLEDVLRSLAGDDWRLVEAIFKNRVQPLLIRLRTLQIEHHRVGLADLDSQYVSLPSDTRPDGSQESSAASIFFDTLLGMAVRDCSVFIKYEIGHSKIEADVKLADLDIKSAKTKKWADTERQLIDGGWYTGTENVAEDRGRRFCRALRRS